MEEKLTACTANPAACAVGYLQQDAASQQPAQIAMLIKTDSEIQFSVHMWSGNFSARQVSDCCSEVGALPKLLNIGTLLTAGIIFSCLRMRLTSSKAKSTAVASDENQKLQSAQYRWHSVHWHWQWCPQTSETLKTKSKTAMSNHHIAGFKPPKCS